MTRILGTITAVILGLIALCGGLVVMAGGALTLLEGKGLAGITAWAATRFTGRQVAIEGPVTIDWGHADDPDGIRFIGGQSQLGQLSRSS